MRPVPTTIAAAVALLTAGHTFAADAKLISKHGVWDASVRTVGKERVCYVSSLPKKTTGKYKKRGEASVIIAHWPKRKHWGEITVNAGYRFKPKSEVLIRIGTKDYRLFTNGEQAYAYKGEDATIVAAMRAGSEMTIAGESAKGTRTADTYSLDGISAAIKAIDGECRGNGKKGKSARKKK